LLWRPFHSAWGQLIDNWDQGLSLKIFYVK
jgi:hypothetical protein